MNHQFNKLMGFLNRLEDAKIRYELRQSRDDAMMDNVYAPGENWEIDFVADGAIDIERYRSDGHIDDESILEELFTLWSEPQPEIPVSPGQNGVNVRN